MGHTSEILTALIAFGFIASHAATWAYYRHKLREFSERAEVRAEHRVIEVRQRFTFLQDGLLQDLQGLTLSLQAIVDQLPATEPVRQRLERILDRADKLLADGQRSMRPRTDKPGSSA